MTSLIGIIGVIAIMYFYASGCASFLAARLSAKLTKALIALLNAVENPRGL